ncbi:MAG: hypothetical protein AB1425_00890 [Actinomycetota bacterium]
MSRPKPVRVLEDPAETTVVLVGCGGTGGYVLQQLCRLLYGLREERKAALAEPPIFGEEPPAGVPEILLIDGDTVSVPNL